MGFIRTFYGTGYATGTYAELYDTYLAAYWAASGDAMNKVNCAGDYEVLLDLSIPTPTHYYNFSGNLLDATNNLHGGASGTPLYSWAKYRTGALVTGDWYVNSGGLTTMNNATIAFWTLFSGNHINRGRTLFANVQQDVGGDSPSSMYRLYVNSANKISVKVFDTVSSDSTTLTGANIVSGDWQFHVVRFDMPNKNIDYSTNGSGFVTTAISALGTLVNASDYQSSMFGAYDGTTGIGKMDSIAFFDSPLTQDQIKALWYGGSGKHYNGVGWVV